MRWLCAVKCGWYLYDEMGSSRTQFLRGCRAPKNFDAGVSRRFGHDVVGPAGTAQSRCHFGVSEALGSVKNTL